MVNKLGSVAFFSTYRPLKPLDLYSLPASLSNPDQHEYPLTDGESYNYNGKEIPPWALKLMLKRLVDLGKIWTNVHVDSGQLTGIIMVSERLTGLETLYIVLRYGNDNPEVFSFADVYGTYDGVRMEDSPTFAGEHIFYITTKDENPNRRQPWTAVYKTHLETGETERVTPPGVSDLNPVASPDGSKLAVASFERNGWHGEIERLMTDIVVIELHNNNNRILTIHDAGWPSWGSENVLFFHRKVIIPAEEKKKDKTKSDYWAVFRADIRNPFKVITEQVTPEGIKAFTPVAIDEHNVVVGTIRLGNGQGDTRTEADEYRQVEIFFDFFNRPEPVSILVTTRLSDHYNPFLIVEQNGYKRIGFHRGVLPKLMDDTTTVKSSQVMTLQSPTKNLGLFRVSGVFPTFTTNGRKLAYVDNEFKSVWLWDPDSGNKKVQHLYTPDDYPETTVFAPVWSKSKDIVYFCQGLAFQETKEVLIMAVTKASSPKPKVVTIVQNNFNNAFPCSNPDGTRLVFRSTKDGGTGNYRPKSLYIREEADVGQEIFNCEGREPTVSRLTKLDGVTDTHCDWSPNGKWIVFSSTRDKYSKDREASEPDFGLDPAYFAVYLLAVDNPDVVILVMQSGLDFAGHVNHPFFSPKGDQIVVSSDIAGVSCDPVSLPLFTHSVRPYGDIFTIDIDPEKINQRDFSSVVRMTHSKFENSTCTWTVFSDGDATGDSSGRHGTDPGIDIFHGGIAGGNWHLVLNQPHELRCPFFDQHYQREGWPMTGHLMIPDSKC